MAGCRTVPEKVSSLSVAFPRAGGSLPFVKRAYVIGATSAAVANITVNGVAVPVFPNGAWGTVTAVAEGTNTLVIADGASTLVHRFVVQAPKTAAGAASAPKIYGKLEYAAERPRIPVAGAAPLVYLDPGHGGPTDCGAVSPHGRAEKEANLLLAAAVAAKLRSRGIAVKMTRSDDRAIPLMERARPAHEAGAAVFVSIHHNAPAIATDPLAARYAAVYSWNPLGAGLAEAIAAKLGAKNLHANFAVTRSPEIPSVLVEADFITHPQGEEDSWNPQEVTRRAECVAAGIVAYLRSSK